jgi:hypothetical protein
MTSVAPPTEFFPGIDFNPSFYNLGQSAVTLDYLNSNFLRSTGYAISRAQFTLFNGTVDINENLDVSGNINASAYLLNGVPFTPSQWTTSVNDIYYTTGNVGIGKTNPSATYKLDVSGNINCNAIFRSGTELTQYTDTNVRTVLGTSAGTNMTWNSSTNRMNVVFPPSPLPYGDTEVRILLSNSAGTNMTWNTGTNRFNVGIATTTSLGVVQVGSGLSITPQGLLSANATSYTLPIATNTTLGGIRVDGSTIVINATTGVISSVQTQVDWNNVDSSSRAFIANKPTIINSRWSQTGSNIFYNSGNVGIGNSAPFAPLCVGNSSIVGSDGNIIFGRNISGGSRHFKLGIDTDYYFGIGDFGANNTAGTWIEPFKVHFLASNNSLVVSANGNVGIGDIPGTTIKLDVNGNLLVRAYGTTGSGTRGIFFRPDHITTNLQYNCSILTFDHGGTGPTDGLSINGFSGLSFCTGANTRQERMRIASNGNVNMGEILTIGSINGSTGYVKLQVYASDNDRLVARFSHPNNTQGIGIAWDGLLALGTNPSQEINIRARGPDGSVILSTNGFTRLRVLGNGNVEIGFGGVSVTGGGVSANFFASGGYILTTDRLYARGGGYDTTLNSTSSGMYLDMGNQSTENNPTFCRYGAYLNNTFIESNSNRDIRFRVHSAIFSGTLREWVFRNDGQTFRALNTTTWNQFSDHRLKENIKKANLKTCYDNVKNINLYRYNYIDAFDVSNDKNRLGYIAQEVKNYFPKGVVKKKHRLNDKREVPDLLSVDVEQINLSLHGAVKQLIKIVEKQDKRIKTLESLLNIEDNNDVEDDAGEEYVKIYDEDECDIDDIEPTEPSNEV